MPPFPSQHSTPGRLWREADPRAISGRTRYHQVRLAFHPYPQVIPRRCTTYGFGPPYAVKRTSSCPWVDHLASGLHPVTRRPVRTRFRYGSAPEGLNLATEHNSPAHTAKGTRSPVPRPLRDLGSGSHCTVGGRFHVLFHSPPGVLFTFPSRYWCAIGQSLVFSLGGWSPQLRAGCHVSNATWDDNQEGPSLSPTGRSPSSVALSSDFASCSAREGLCDFPRPPQGPPSSSPNPAWATAVALHPHGLGSSPFARRY